MAIIIPAISGAVHNDDGSVKVIKWEAMGGADTGTPVSVPQFADKTVTVSGTFGGATVALQGSNDGAAWFTLTDPQGNTISTTSATMEAVIENPLFIRPSTTGGTGSSVNVIICARLANTLRT